MDIDDLAGLNRTRIVGASIIDSAATAVDLLQRAGQQSLAVAGLRHSQGGHTVRSGGRMLLTETMREVRYETSSQTVIADAGATWSQIHHVLRPYRRALPVHQSSAHFTVGGSIAVNCHGRDPSQGPIGNTVERLWVLCGDGAQRECSRTAEPELFRAVIGGYGACGLILRAELRTVEDVGLAEVWYRCTKADVYLKHIAAKLPRREGYSNTADLHFGWLCPVPGKDFLDEVIAADYPRYEHGPGNPNPDPIEAAWRSPPREESWGSSEIMRAAWAAGRLDQGIQELLWKELQNPSSTLFSDKSLSSLLGLRPIGERRPPDLRSNWMRASVSFTASRGRDGPGGHGSTDLLQEFFVPLDKGGDMIGAIRHALLPGNRAGIRLLSCTLRVVQADELPTLLSYAPQKRLCIALDLHVPVSTPTDGVRQPTTAVRETLSNLIDKSHDLGGTFYLPYFRFASTAQFQAAYGPGAAALQKAIARYDPQQRFWNEFLDTYLR